MKTVLFLCTGNSCRSQMAEAIVNVLYPEWKAYSAGTKPAGYVHPKAIQVLAEIDIPHSGISKHIDDLHTRDFDLVVTVCDSAAAKGNDEEQLAVFRLVRGEMWEVSHKY